MIAWLRARPKVAAAAGAALALYAAWLFGLLLPLRGDAVALRVKREDARRAIEDLDARGVPSSSAVSAAETQLAREQESAQEFLERVASRLPEEYRAPEPEQAVEAFDTRRADDERRFERRITWRQRVRGLGFSAHPAPDEAAEWLTRLGLVATVLDLALEAGVREVEAIDPLGEMGGTPVEAPEGTAVRALRVRVVVLGSSEGIFKLVHALVNPERRGFIALVAFHATQVAPGQDRLRAEFTVAGLEPAPEGR